MKRSEVVNLIALILQVSGNHYCDDGRDKDAAEDILKTLEDIRMEPPPYITEADTELMKSDPDMWNEQLYFGYEGLRQWEPEDEQS